MSIDHQATFGRRAEARTRAAQWRRPGWKAAGALALLCSGVAWASFPRPAQVPLNGGQQWQALGVAPLSAGAATGMSMAPTEAVRAADFVPKRAAPAVVPIEPPAPAPLATGPLRIRGRVGDGLYWSLRAAGASPQVAAEYLAALATEIDVGDVAQNDGFDLVSGRATTALRWPRPGRARRAAAGPLERQRPKRMGRRRQCDASCAGKQRHAMPVNGPITSYFGYRYHPILHFTRFHAGVDIGAGWGAPIVAAGDGRVIGAGWGGGYGREVEIAHGGGVTSIYGHMSEIVAQPGSFVRAGQLIGYVGSSGLATGPHLHFEVRQGGQPVNPLAIRFVSAPVVDAHLAEAVKERLKVLLGVGIKHS